jgi:hypothetical protein
VYPNLRCIALKQTANEIIDIAYSLEDAMPEDAVSVDVVPDAMTEDDAGPEDAMPGMLRWMIL